MRYENKTFRNETVRLDDSEFINCRFIDCKWVISGPDFTLQDVQFDGQFELIVEGDANNALNLFRMLAAHPPTRDYIRRLIGL